MMQVKKFKIYAGLSGGFGGAKYDSTVEVSDQVEAEQIAYEIAYQIYDNMAGYHGLLDWNDCRMEAEKSFSESEIDSEDSDIQSEIDSMAEEIYQEEQEHWISCYVEEVIEKT